ncbi:MAG: ubiquinone biosynthesis regulatory protein kinase UbiB [Oceanococcus sp.]
MTWLRQIRRFWQIFWVCRRYGLDQFLGRRPNKVFALPRGERARLALQELGPVFIKFGQALSTRPDLLPDDIAAELSLLQDAVPAFDGAIARQRIEKSLGQPIEKLFAAFDETPLASASVAQVHAARLPDAEEGSPGLEVVIKVLRPGIQKAVEKDLDLLHFLAGLAAQFAPDADRLHPREVVNEYQKVILDELDLLREAANASQLRRNWLGSELIYHPLVFFDLSRSDVLVMERLYGRNIDEVDALRADGVDFQVLSERGVEIFFRQVFRDNFFHADMHPGNIFVDASNPKKPRYLALDFGIVGTLTPEDQRYLAENFLAFFNQDYRRVAELHLESGWIPADVRVDEFESAIRSVCEPIFNKPLKDISFGMFLMRLFQVARRFKMEVQPQLVLLQKTLLNIEGLGRQLYPELDLWKTAKPIMEDWMRQRLSPLKGLDEIKQHLPAIVEAVPDMLRRLQQDWPPAEFAAQTRELHALRVDISEQQTRNRWALVGGLLALAAAIVLALDGRGPARIADVPLASWGLGVVSVWCFLRTLLPGAKS